MKQLVGVSSCSRIPAALFALLSEIIGLKMSLSWTPAAAGDVQQRSHKEVRCDHSVWS